MKTSDGIGFLLIITSKALLIFVANVVKRYCPLPVLHILQIRFLIEYSLTTFTQLFILPLTIAKNPNEKQNPLFTLKFWLGHPKDRKYSFLRGVFYWCFLLCYFKGLRLIPFSHASIIMSCKPLVVAIAAYLVLGESTHPLRPTLPTFIAKNNQKSK